MSGVFSKKWAFFCTAGVAAGALLAGPAMAQEAGLRGRVDESQVNAELLGPNDGAVDNTMAGATGIPSDAYQAAGSGAVSSAQDGTLLPDFADDPAFASNRRPSTAEVRHSGENEREEDSNQPALPDTALDATSTGSARAISIDAQEAKDASLRMNPRVQPIEGGFVRREDNPYSPLGLRLGTFTVVPTLEEGLTWTSNANNDPNGSEAVLSESTLRLNAVSDWSRHQATIDGYGTYSKSLSGEEISEFEGGVEAALRLDLADSLSGRAGLAYSVRRESASSPDFIAGVDRQPLRHTFDGELGVEKTLGRIRLGATGEITRDQYGEARLDNGETLSQDDRNSTLALMRLRGGYELSPALIPFLEVEAGRRVYDEERDAAGFARSGNRYGVRAGVALDLSEKLSGEMSAGWVSQEFEDSRLDAVSGLDLRASLGWSPMRGTLVNLDASTTVEGSTDAGESGSLLHSGTLRLERQMRANLTGNVAAGVAYRDYSGDGHDLVLSGEAALTWWLNRYAGLTGRLRHERQTSNLPGRDYETSSVFLGMKFQR